MNLGLSLVVVAIVLLARRRRAALPSSAPIIGIARAPRAPAEAAGLGARRPHRHGRRQKGRYLGRTGDSNTCPKANRELEFGVIRDGAAAQSPRHAARYRQIRDRRSRHRPDPSASVHADQRRRSRRARRHPARRRRRRPRRPARACRATSIIEEMAHQPGQAGHDDRSSGTAKEQDVTVVPESDGGIGMVRVILSYFEVRQVDPEFRSRR